MIDVAEVEVRRARQVVELVPEPAVLLQHDDVREDDEGGDQPEIAAEI
ncbi:MAG: hypothetical protein ABIO71_02435 [Caldimonas sp.]